VRLDKRRLGDDDSLVLVRKVEPRKSENAIHLDSRSSSTSVRLGLIVARTYERTANVLLFQFSSIWSMMTVIPGGATFLRVDLQPVGMLHFVVQLGKTLVPFWHVTLTSPALAEGGGQRVLDATPSVRAADLTTEDYCGNISLARFSFHNLPAGGTTGSAS